MPHTGESVGRRPSRSGTLGRLGGPRAALAVALAVLALALVVDVVTLTRAPVVYSDEGWVASSWLSVADGGPLRPTVILGTGLVDHGAQQWMPKIGNVPGIVVAAIASAPSLALYRGVALVIGLLALVVFWLALRRRIESASAVAATAALAMTWGFFAANHYVRWDSFAMLIACALLWRLMRGPPDRRAAIVTGLLLGVAFDIQFSLLGVFPAVLALMGWERAERWTRVALTTVCMAVPMFVIWAMRVLPDPDTARKQYDALVGNSYAVPISRAVRDVSLTPLTNEWHRYDTVFAGPLVTPATVAVGLLVVGALIGLAAALQAVRTRAYPLVLVPGLLALAQIVGAALINGNRATMMPVWYGLPYAVAAIATVPVLLGARLPRWLPSAGLAVLAVALTLLVVRETRQTPRQAALDAGFQRQAQSATRGAGTIMAEQNYWWTFRDDRVRSNSNIYLWQSAHRPGFDRAFRALCPDAVIYDDLWRQRFGEKTAFPTLAPTDPRDRQRLEAMLSAHYRRVLNTVVDATHIGIWRRSTATCS